jgi:hypothetical protein
VSWITSLAGDAIAGRVTGNEIARIDEALSDLESIGIEVEDCPISEEERDPYRRYIADTRDVIVKLRDSVTLG